uniref:EasH n=1 Tax=Claviceps gigantea TaxID=89175 RepID=A0A2H4P5D2_9HYPO|nr:EasH [Claviceps gigantea]
MESPPQQRTKRFSMDSDPVAIHQAIVEDGVAVIEGFLTPEQVEKLNRDVDARLLAYRNRARPEVTDKQKLWTADFVLEHVARVHNLVDFSHVFRHEILNHGLLHEICRRTFWESGDYWLGFGAVIENGPGTEQQKWHRDQPIYPLVKQGPDAPEGMLNFFTALTDLDDETGRTQYIWGSNKWEELGTPDALHPIENVALKAGDTTIVSGKVTHRGSANLSRKFRRAMPIMMVPSILTPFDATCHLSRELVETMTPLAQKMVGRRSVMIPPPGTTEGVRTGIWCLNMRELGEQLGLKSNQPEQIV